MGLTPAPSIDFEAKNFQPIIMNSNPRTWTAPNCSTPEERQQAKVLYEGGMSITEVAEQLNRSSSAVYEWVSGNASPSGYTIKEWKGKAGAEEKQKAIDVYKKHKSIPKVCKEVDRSYETVRRWLKDAGVDTSQHVSKTKQVKKNNRLEQENAELRAEIAKLKAALAALVSQ